MPQGSPSLPQLSSKSGLQLASRTSRRGWITDRSGQKRGEKRWPPMGRSGGHQWGLSMAASGEIPMAAVRRRDAGQPWPSASSSWCEINQDKINLFAAATSSSTSAASDKCCCGSPPISRSSRAQRPPPAGASPQAGNVCSFELGTGKPALGRSGNCAPTSLTLRGAQMDLGPPAP